MSKGNLTNEQRAELKEKVEALMEEYGVAETRDTACKIHLRETIRKEKEKAAQKTEQNSVAA